MSTIKEGVRMTQIEAGSMVKKRWILPRLHHSVNWAGVKKVLYAVTRINLNGVADKLCEKHSNSQHVPSFGLIGFLCPKPISCTDEKVMLLIDKRVLCNN